MNIEELQHVKWKAVHLYESIIPTQELATQNRVVKKMYGTFFHNPQPKIPLEISYQM